MVEYGIIVGLIAIMVGTVAIAYGPAMIHWYENRAVTEQQGNAALSELMYANNGITMTVSPSAGTVALGTPVVITALVKNVDGSPAVDALVSWSISGGGLTGWGYSTAQGTYVDGGGYTIRVDAQGYAGLRFTPNSGSGTPAFSLTATSGMYEATASTSVQVP